MQYSLGKVCICEQVFRTNLPGCLIGPLLLCIEGMIAFMIFLLLSKMDDDSTRREMLFGEIVTGICGILFLTFMVVGYFYCKRLYFAEKMTKWTILNCEEDIIDKTLLLNDADIEENDI